MLQANALEQTTAFDQELTEARQGRTRIKQSEVTGQAFIPLPEFGELLCRDPIRSTAARHWV